MVQRRLLQIAGWTCWFWWAQAEAAAEGTGTRALNRAGQVATAVPETSRDSTWAQIPNAWYELTPEDLDVGEDRGVCGINSLTVTSEASACRLRIAFPQGRRAVCSGWIIGTDKVGTAGHCIYNKEAGGYARQIYVDCGKEDACEASDDTYNAVKWVTTEGWIENGHTEGCSRFSNDGAVIKVDRAFRKRDVLTVEPYTCERNMDFTVTGYPGSTGQQCSSYTSCVQKTASGSIMCPSSILNGCGLLSSSTLDGCAGMSGSALISSSSNKVVGIYAAQRMGFICANYYAFLTEQPSEGGVDIWDLQDALE